MLTLSEKLCTIANGNRSGHDLWHSIELFIEANFVHSNCGVHRWGFRKKYNPPKKSANQFGVKPRRKCLKRARSTF